MTVQDLIEIAEDFQARAEDTPEILDKELRFASQPEWPFEYHIQCHNWPENDEAANTAADVAGADTAVQEEILKKCADICREILTDEIM